jgi:hypothetical protein
MYVKFSKHFVSFSLQLNNKIINVIINIFFIERGFVIVANVSALGEEADFEARNCLPALNLIQSIKLHLSTEPAFLPNAC